MLISDMIEHNGMWRGDRPALITADHAIHWREFAARVRHVANGLIAHGLAGERIGMVMDNESSAVELLFGAMRAGVTVVPLNIGVSDAVLNSLLSDADIRALAVSPQHRHRITPAIQAMTQLRLTSDDRDHDDWRSYAAWRDQHAAPMLNAGFDAPHQALRPPVAPDALCNIIYSSGTTGTPKGIMHSHQARVDWAHDLAHALRYHSGAKTLITTGLYSNITWVAMLPSLMLGGTLLLHAGFDVNAALDALNHHAVTHMAMVPVQLQRLVAAPNFTPDAFARLHSLMCCGSPLPAPLKAQLLSWMPSAFIELYGSTEGIITTLAPEDAADHIGSVGRPLPGEQLAILTAQDTPAPVGESGEVVAASRFAMAGYWRRPDATNDAQWIAPDGTCWLRSGDIGRLDVHGYLTITDRKKDMIISGGQNIYPADIEAILIEHPDVIDCAVIGIPSPKWGETPLALVVLHTAALTTKAAETAETLRRWTNARLGRQQKIERVEFRPELARNPNGKLLKRELRQPYWDLRG